MLRGLTVFGERPGPKTDPLRPLYPHTTTGAAAHLIGLLGVSTEAYLAETERYNVYHDGAELLGLEAARLRVTRLMTAAITAHGTGARFLYVGKEALRAAPQLYRRMEFLQTMDLVMLLPHTSGVNRWYNSAENTEQARAALAAFTAPLAGK